MEYTIAKGDTNPRLFAFLSATFTTANIPDQYKIIYSEGNQILLYYKIGNTWATKTAQVIDNYEGRKLRVAVQFEADDFSKAGEYKFYFRNEDLQISFPNDNSYGKIKVTDKQQ